MADFNNIPLALKITNQIPLNYKEYVLNEATLSDLGVNNNLAYTYHDNIEIFCKEEKTIWKWREVQAGEENTGLLELDFNYPPSLIVDGVDYSNKVYNFFKQDYITSNNILEYINIESESLIVTTDFSTNTIQIEQPQTSTIPALYVNQDYIPSYKEWFDNGGNIDVDYYEKGKGTLSKPFTNSIKYLSTTSFSIISYTSIDNCLEKFLGSGTRLIPEKSNQQIIVQKSNNGPYIFNNDFSYNNFNLKLEETVLSTTDLPIVDFDNTSYFGVNDILSSRIETTSTSVLYIKSFFRNSGTYLSTTNYNTSKIIYLIGNIFEEEVYTPGKYMLLSNPENTLNGIVGTNNDGGLCIQVKNANIKSRFNGICKLGGKSKIEFIDSDIGQGYLTESVNTSLNAIYNNGGLLRFFNSTLSYGSTRINGILLNSTSNFISKFVVRNTRFTGNTTNWFVKLGTNNVLFDISNSNSLFFSGNQLFNSPNLWSVNFKDNTFESINVDFAKVDFTNNNTSSSTNTIGNNVIQQLVKHPSRFYAKNTALLPVGSLFINTNNMSIFTSDPSWKIDIVL